MKKRSAGRLLLTGIILPIVLLALLLAACGSGSDENGQTADTPPIVEATETRAPMAEVVTDSAAINTDAALSTNQITESAPVAPVAGPIEGSLVYTDLTNLHRPDQINYSMNPPVGGDHNPAWMNCGVYTVTLPSELAVHSMEHGAVWITYQPTIPAEQIETLKTLTKAGNFRLLNPNPDQDSPVIATAWGAQIKLPSADDSRLQEFIDRYENRKDGPEYGAPCSGAYGEPEK